VAFRGCVGSCADTEAMGSDFEARHVAARQTHRQQLAESCWCDWDGAWVAVQHRLEPACLDVTGQAVDRHVVDADGVIDNVIG